MTKHLLLAAMILAGLPFASAADELVAVDRIEQGRALAFERRKGNCLACHLIEGGELAGNYGPPLLMMKARFPDREHEDARSKRPPRRLRLPDRQYRSAQKEGTDSSSACE